MHRERRINRRRQGDLGEASAIEWLTRQGATVFLPFGHSPDVDLVAEVDGRLLRVQVKTSTQRATTPDGHSRFPVMIATNGGNQSWSGLTKRCDPATFDLLFVLTGNGRRWLIPAAEIEARNCITLGGPKYSEFEIDLGGPIRDLVYSRGAPSGQNAPLESISVPGEYPSGQRTATVNRQAQPSQVRILPPPSTPSEASADQQTLALDPPVVARGSAPHGQTRVSGNRQIVIPKRAFDAAGLNCGDRLKATAAGAGEVLFRRVAREALPN
jgi:hypothetical protein